MQPNGDLGVLYAQLDEVLHRILTETGLATPTDAIYPQQLTLEYERLDPDGHGHRCQARLPLRADTPGGSS